MIQPSSCCSRTAVVEPVKTVGPGVVYEALETLLPMPPTGAQREFARSMVTRWFGYLGVGTWRLIL